MDGARYVLHVASPLGDPAVKDRDALVGPAREGTLRVLRAAAGAGAERVVMTSAANAATAMQSAQANFSPTTVVDPRVWAQNGVVPLPTSGYPISGFSWFNFYECYNTSSAFYNMVLPILYFHYTDSITTSALALNGFAPVPATWVNAIGYLVAGSYTPLNADVTTTAAFTGRSGA